jgi:predicted PurR-regulated permease PerM
MAVLIFFLVGMVAGYLLRPAINRFVRKLMNDIRNNNDG